MRNINRDILGGSEQSKMVDPSIMRSNLVDDLGRLNFLDADERRLFPVKLHSLLKSYGLFGLMTKVEQGGIELSLKDAANIIAAVSAFDISAASTLVIHNFLSLPCIEKSPDVPLHHHIMLQAAQGELCAFALTEPEAGSAPQHIGTTAFISGGKVRLNGRKVWIGLADWARWIVCFARAVGPDAEGRFVGLLVDRYNPSLTIAHEHRTLGLRGIIQNTIEFHDLEMSSAYIISPNRNGWVAASSSMNRGRVGVAAMSLGAIERAIQIAISYAGHRQLAKVPLIQNRYIENKLEHMVLQREIVSAMLNASCSHFTENGQPNIFLASATKIISSEWCGEIADRCVQLLGGRGYDEGATIAKIYRDVRIFRIFEGPTEVLLAYLGRCYFSEVFRIEIFALFKSLDASDIYNDIVEALSGCDGSDGIVLIHAGWLITSGLSLSIMLYKHFSVSNFVVKATELATSNYRSLRARSPTQADSVNRASAKDIINEFLAETASSIRSPVFTNDYMRVERYV